MGALIFFFFLCLHLFFFFSPSAVKHLQQPRCWIINVELRLFATFCWLLAGLYLKKKKKQRWKDFSERVESFGNRRRKNTLNFGAGPGILNDSGCGPLAQMCSPECYSGCIFLPPHLSVAFTCQYFTFILIIDRLSTWPITRFVQRCFYTSAKRVCRAEVLF